MKKFFHPCILFFMLISLVSAKEAINIPNKENDPQCKPATIKLRLFSSDKGALIEARGAYEVINTMNGRKLSWGNSDKRFHMYGHNSGIKWGENFLGIFQITLLPKSESSRFLINGIEYPGAIEIYNAKNSLIVINELTIEDFLKATLSPAVSDIYKLSTYEALAIAMRTHYYHIAEKNADSFWHLDAAEIGYNGCGLSLQNLPLEAGILSTKHVVMKHNKTTFPSGFSTHCAGKTASYKQVLRVKSIECPSGVISPYAQQVRTETRWKERIPLRMLAQKIKLNRITNIETFRDPSSQKVYAIRLFDGIHSVDLPIKQLQHILGKNQIKSNDFIAKVYDDAITFEGFGQGLGIGICLYSANKMAEKSDDALKILSFFYPNVEFSKVKSLPTVVKPRLQHIDYLPGDVLSDGPRRILHK
ncbi:hypothetical protein COB21_01040 [Candidatus Aerophobetes bacterium]|uniref:Uncharacterized protein n=1 Tax=Aerophobetes bacterium TaxID=2030807 RepID=A0A2A4X857_UNCAE|nr:MAG: hypothetical protein COB21_01040 [Candidatus Aerophobetes bacterium]